jgi:hypothetical protein
MCDSTLDEAISAKLCLSAFVGSKLVMGVALASRILAGQRTPKNGFVASFGIIAFLSAVATVVVGVEDACLELGCAVSYSLLFLFLLSLFSSFSTVHSLVLSSTTGSPGSAVLTATPSCST